MQFQKDGDIHIKMRGQLKTLLTDLRFQYKILNGSCNTFIPGEKDRTLRYFRFYLKPETDRLFGYYTAHGSYISKTTGTDVGQAYTGYISLTRKLKKEE